MLMTASTIVDPNASGLDKALAAFDLVSPVSSGEIRSGMRAADNMMSGGSSARNAARQACCFVAGTLVDTENGLRRIEEVQVGDLVWARDVDTGETRLQPVTDLIRRHERVIWEVELVAFDGSRELFETTDDHPWWIAGEGWKTTEELSPGAAVVTRDGRGMVIARVEQTDRVDATYNLTVDVFHTYFVGDQRVLVHNCPTGGGRPQRESPVTEAVGAHSTFRRDGSTGDINHTATWSPNERNPSGFDLQSRTDVTGPSHTNKVTGEDVPTPHVHDRSAPGGVRRARPEEIPTQSGP